MSLLMQALKKAEQAKQQAAVTESGYPTLEETTPTAAAPQTTVESKTVPPEMELTIADPNPATSVEDKRVEPMLAEKEQPMPLQFEPEQAAPSKVEPVLQQSMTLQDLIPSTPSAQRPSPEQAIKAQQQAQSVLMAKQPAGSNRSFMILAGGLLILLLCAAAVFYFWQASTQQSGVPMTNRAIAQAPAVPAPAVSAPAVPAPVQTAPVASTPAVIPTVPAAGSETTPSALDRLVARRPAPTNPAARRPRPDYDIQQPGQPPMQQLMQQSMQLPTHKSMRQPLQLSAPQSDPQQIQISKGQLPAKINATLTEAYHLFTSGDRNAARPLYESVLRQEPNNRDALLGLAAVELSAHHNEQAAALYSKLLDLDPTDADGIAGLTSLRRDHPDQSESQLKKGLASNPQSGATLFELGNLYSQQSRWSEAQDAYFRAFASSPRNADYAFNLAVSLDRLGQIKLALDYYRRALTLASVEPGNFSQAAATARINELQQAAGQ